MDEEEGPQHMYKKEPVEDGTDAEKAAPLEDGVSDAYKVVMQKNKELTERLRRLSKDEGIPEPLREKYDGIVQATANIGIKLDKRAEDAYEKDPEKFERDITSELIKERLMYALKLYHAHGTGDAPKTFTHEQIAEQSGNILKRAGYDSKEVMHAGFSPDDSEFHLYNPQKGDYKTKKETYH